MPSCYSMVMCSNTGAQVSKSHRKLSQVALFWLAPAAWGGRTDGSQATCGLCSSDWISKFARLRCEFAKEHVRTQIKSCATWWVQTSFTHFHTSWSFQFYLFNWFEACANVHRCIPGTNSNKRPKRKMWRMYSSPADGNRIGWRKWQASEKLKQCKTH